MTSATTRVMAVANQKGGVAKTTTVHSVASALGALGRRVLVVDLDPQASLTRAMGIDPDRLKFSLHDVMLRRVKAAEVLLKTGDVHLLPSTIDLAGAEMHLLTKTGREYVLRRALEPLLADYDLVIVDCPPSLGILTINGLTAATEVLIPLQCDTLSQRGVSQLLETIEEVRAYTNPSLSIQGAVATMFDGRTNLAREVLSEVRARYGLEVLDPPVPKSVKVAKARGRRRTVLEHAPRSRSAAAYQALAATLDPGETRLP
ncbi:MAG: AAA family ATPase [Acidimicrobiales bacterium]